MTLYFNATEGPVLINDNGVTVGGGEWFESELTDQIRASISRNEVVRINARVAEKFEELPLSYDASQEEADAE